MAGLNMALVRRRRMEIQKQEEEFKKGKNFDQLKEGANKRRILPPWSDAGDWRKKAGYHYNVLEQGGVLCPKVTWDKPCPLCDMNKSLFKSESAEDKEFAKKIRAKERFYANVLNLNLNDGKVYVMEFGTKMEADIIGIMDPGDSETEGEEKFGLGDITDPKSGRNLQITKTVPEDKLQTKYEVKASQSATPVANWEEISKNLVNLDEYVRKDEYSIEDLTAMANGTFSDSSKSESKPEAKSEKAAPAGDDEFGGKPKKPEAKSEVTDEFESPKEEIKPNPPAEKAPAQTGAAKTALDKLKAMKEGKK